MKTRIPLALAALAAAGALFVAGCGGGDDSSSTTASSASGATGASGTALTTEEFLKQGNAICAAGNKDTQQAAEQTFTGQKPTQAQVEQFASVLVPSVQSQIDAISALTPPADLADQVSTFLDDAQSALAKVKADPSLLLANDSDGPFADVNAQAKQIGLDECGG